MSDDTAHVRTMTDAEFADHEIDITPKWYTKVAATDASAAQTFIFDVTSSWMGEKTVFGVAVRAHLHRDLNIRADANGVVALISEVVPYLSVLVGAMRERLGTDRAGEIASARLALLRGEGSRSEGGVFGEPSAKTVELSREDTDEKILDVSLPNGKTRRFLQHTTLV